MGSPIHARAHTVSKTNNQFFCMVIKLESKTIYRVVQAPLPWSKLLETQILTRDQFAVLTFLQHSPRFICPFAAIRREPVIFHKLLHFFGVEMLGSVVTKNYRPRHRPRIFSEQLLLMGMCNYRSEI